ncbi:MAG: WbqC family protein [Clostridiales bacterium]|nr:WbqC family protein [Clostridiales bacterium]
MILAIDQPNYIPWKGYFDLINDVDLFIFYNDVQYTTRDWRNRNTIITPNGIQWLTVPVGSNTNRLICDVKINNKSWQRKHYETIRFAYGRTPYFYKYRDFFEDCYLGREWDYLFELDQYLTVEICRQFLGVKTKFADSRDYSTIGKKNERLLSLIENVGGVDIYESGPAAKNYMITKDYKDRGITVRWKEYNGYPEYPQAGTEFTHNVSILDLLFNTGENAPYYIWGWREKKGILSYCEEQ